MFLINFQSKRPGKSKGQSLVEFAIILVVLMLLLAGAIDAGMAFFSYIALHDAAQEGAVYGSTHPTSTTDIEARIRSVSDSPIDFDGADAADVTVPAPIITGPACRGSTITVIVTYNYHLLMPFAGSVFNSQTIPITARVTNVILSPGCGSP